MHVVDRVGSSLRIALGAVILIASAATDVARAATKDEARWFLQFAGGASSMQLDDVKSYYEGVLDSYRASAIPIETQREFPANLIVGGDLLYALPRDFRIGVGTRYTWSHAYALYGDFAGTLDVVGEVQLLAFQIVVEKAWSTAGSWSPFVELRAGSGRVSINVSQTIVLTQYAQGGAEVSLDGDGRAPLAELHVGIRHPMGRSFLLGTAGYRHCTVPGPPFELQVSGFIATLGLGLVIH